MNNFILNIMLKKEIKEFLSSQRIEYFDDRFYKLSFPPESVPALSKYFSQFPNLINLTDVYLPSVTTYLGFNIDPFLPKWRGEVGNVYADYISAKALNLGSEIHRIIDSLLNGASAVYNNPKNPHFGSAQIEQLRNETEGNLIIVESQEVALQLKRFENVCEVFQPHIIQSETIVYSLKRLYAGTLDQIWKLRATKLELGRNKYDIPAGNYIVDIKTGKNINENQYYAQLAAYANADSLAGLKIKGAIILHLNAGTRTGIEGVKLFVKSKKELKPYFDYFLRTQKNYLFANNPQPTLYELPVFFNFNNFNNLKK